MNSFAALSQSDEPSEQDIEFLQLKALNPDVKVNLSETPFDNQKYPSHVSLLACSSKFGYFVVGTPKGFVYGDLSKLRATFNNADKGTTASLTDKIEVPISQGPVHHLRLTAGQDKIIVGLADGHILLFDAKSVATKTTLQPIKIFSAGSAILDIRPNPEANPDIVAVLLSNHTCQYMSLSTGSSLTLPDNDATAICWSPKGKQITVGNRKGYLSQYDQGGALKTAVEPPEAMTVKGGEEQDRYVQSVLWVENNIFLPVYAAPSPLDDDQPAHMYDGYIITRQPMTSNKTYTRLTDICMPFGQQDRQGQYYMEVVKSLGPEAPYVILVASAPSSAIGIVGQDKSGDWAVWNLDDTSRGNLPLSERTDIDTSPFGLALDFSSSEPLEPLDPSEPENMVAPVPILYYLNDEVNMGAFHCLNVEAAKRKEAYGGIVKAKALAPSTAPATSFSSASASQPTPFTSTFGGPGGFGAGKTTTPSSAPATSAPAAQSTLFSTTFGGPGGFGANKTTTPATAPNATGFSGFGSSAQESKSSPAPAFNFDKSGATPGTPPATASFKFGSSNQSAAPPKPGTPSSGFAFQAKPAAPAPTATAGFSTQTKPAFDGFKTGSPLQTPSSFGSSAKSDTSDAGTFKVDKPSLSFGAASPSTAPSPSVASSAVTPKLTAAQLSTSSAEAQQKEVLKGMAKEFESTFTTLSSELANLAKFAEASEKLNASNRQTTSSLKTLDALKNVDQWKLNDMKTQINLTRQLLEKVKGLQSDRASIKSHLSKLDKEAVKNAHKQQEIQNLIDAKSNSKSQSVKATHLGPEAQETLRKLEEATMKINDTIKNTEQQVERAKKNLLHSKKSSRGLAQPSLYTIHRTLRDIRNGLFVHNVELDEVEAKLGTLSIEEKVRPRSHSSRFSFDELMGEEIVPSKSNQSVNRLVQLPPASPQAIETASQMLLEENFLYKLSDAATTRQPAIRRISSQPVVERGRSYEPLDPSPLGIDLASLDISDINTPRSLKAPVKEPNVIEFTDTEEEADQEEEEEENEDQEEEWEDEYDERDDGSQEAEEEWEDEEEDEQPEMTFVPPTFGKNATPASAPERSFKPAEQSKSVQPTEPVKLSSFGQQPAKEQQAQKKEPATFSGFDVPQKAEQSNVSEPEEPKFSDLSFGQKQSEPQPVSTLEQPANFSSFGCEQPKEQPKPEQETVDEQKEEPKLPEPKAGTATGPPQETESAPEPAQEPAQEPAPAHAREQEQSKLEEQPQEAEVEDQRVEVIQQEEPVAGVEVLAEPAKEPGTEDDEYVVVDGNQEAEDIDIQVEEIPAEMAAEVDEVSEAASALTFGGSASFNEPSQATDFGTSTTPFGSTATMTGFGSTDPAATTSFSGSSSFGNASSATPSFGSTTDFGASSGQGLDFESSTAAPVFGASPPATTFGSNAPTTGFGASTTASSFGGSTATAPFGVTPSTSAPFGSQAASASSFGSFSAPFGGDGSTTSAPFGSSSGTSGFGTPAASAFGSQQQTPAFGSTTSFGGQAPTAQPSFGSTTSFGANATGFGAKAAPAFGATTALSAPGFGTTSNLGSNYSRGFGSAPSSTFGSSTSFGSSGGGFAAAAQSGTGFGAAAQQGQNIFANQQPNANTFTPAAPFGQPQQQQQKPFGGANPAFTQFRSSSMDDD